MEGMQESKDLGRHREKAVKETITIPYSHTDIHPISLRYLQDA